jgi:YVTN family beta-propeller protein
MGMVIFNGRLYVADISDVVVVDTKTGHVEKKINIPGASGLNDITISDKGLVYVSDSKTGKVWKIDNDIPQVFMDSINGVNGLKAMGDELLVLGGKSFFSVNTQKKITKIAELPQGGDGVEPVGNGDYIATSWSGFVYYVYADGRVETLLDTSKEKRNTADIGYDPVKKIIYVPTFNRKTIAAYQLK